MVEQLILQTVLTYLTLISVPVGVFYHIMTLRSQSAQGVEPLMRALSDETKRFGAQRRPHWAISGTPKRWGPLGCPRGGRR